MGRIMDIRNCGGVELNGTLFTFADHTWNGANGHVTMRNVVRTDAGLLTSDGTIAEDNVSIGGRNILQLSDRMRLDGSFWNDGSGGVTFGGGILAPITLTYNIYLGTAYDDGTGWVFTPPTGVWDTISVHVLGILPPDPNNLPATKVSNLDMSTVSNTIRPVSQVRVLGIPDNTSYVYEYARPFQSRSTAGTLLHDVQIQCVSHISEIFWQSREFYGSADEYAHVYGWNMSVDGVAGGATVLCESWPLYDINQHTE